MCHDPEKHVFSTRLEVGDPTSEKITTILSATIVVKINCETSQIQAFLYRVAFGFVLFFCFLFVGLIQFNKDA